MSRAFTKERDDAPEPVIETHSAGVPVRVTAAGEAKLKLELAQTESPAERKRLAGIVADLVVVEPPRDRSRVAVGATVDVRGDAIGTRRFTVVSPDEADVASGRVSDSSPLGAALLGARVGDVVMWHRPAGDAELTIDAIAYEDATHSQRPPP